MNVDLSGARTIWVVRTLVVKAWGRTVQWKVASNQSKQKPTTARAPVGQPAIKLSCICYLSE